MGAPRSRFAAQFVTLLQLQTYSCLQAVPTEEDFEYKPQPSSGKTKKSGSEKGSGNKSNICQESSGIVKNRELHEEQESYCRQIAVISRDNSKSKDFELEIKSDIRRNGHYDMKRRNVLDGKPRRPVKRPTTSSKIGENFYGSSSLVYLKLLVLWGVVIVADYFLEFRFEYLWPFWLFLRSVYDSFKYQGLAFSVFFICIAVTSDMICFLFIPVHWLFFAASTYVWVQYVWHTEKGFCVPTVFLWLLFVYIEASIRLKEFKAHLDLKHLPFHLDLCRPFAAHCIGYPVVTLGFGFKSYVGFRMRLRRQKEVQKENEYYYEFLREALPPGPVRDEAFNINPQPSPKPCSEDRISADGGVIAGPPTPCPGGSGGLAGSSTLSSSALSIDSGGGSTSTISASGASGLPSSSTLMTNGDGGTQPVGGGSGSHGHHGGGTSGLNGSLMSSIAGLANGKHHHNGDLNHLAATKLASLGASATLSNGSSLNNNAGGELDYMEKMRGDDPAHGIDNHGSSSNVGPDQGSSDKNSAASATASKRSSKSNHVNSAGGAPRDASRKGRSSAASGGSGLFGGLSPSKDELICKMESDIKKLKVDLQLSRNKENDLRDQIVSFMTGERTLKSEISNLQVEKSLLESRVKGLMSTRADEKATLSSLERKLAEERRQKTDFQIKLETERKVKKEAASAEKTAQQNQTRSEVAKLEAEMNTLRSELDRARDRCETAEREAYQLRSYKEVHGDPEVLVNALKGVQEKNRQLEIKLSEETKVKLDLFSALGEAKREIGIRENQLGKKDHEVSHMSAKIAELLACMPSQHGPSAVPRVTTSPVTVTSLASYVSAAGGQPASAGGQQAGQMGSVNGAGSLSLDLPQATDLSSFNTGKLTGLGLSNLEEKLGSLFSTPTSLGSGFQSKSNGNSNME